MKVKLRHKLWFKIVGPLMTIYLRKKFNYTWETCDMAPPFLVLTNHTMDFDPFFVAKGFSCPIYFVMSDHVSSLKAGKLINHLVSPIPITKSSIDAETVRNIFSIVKQGGSVGIFPEGNKSFSGDMSWIKPSTAKLAKKLDIPVVLYTVEGGYFSSPRWSKTKRKGHIHGKVADIITAEEIRNLSEEDLYNRIKNNLRINAYEIQEKSHVKFEAPENRADTIESFLYACPECNSLNTIKGDGNFITCTNCGMRAELDEFGYISGCKIKRLDDWDKFQKDLLRSLDLSKVDDTTPLLCDKNWEVQKKIDKFKSQVLGNYESKLTKKALILTNQDSQNDIIKIDLSDIAGSAIEGACGTQLWLKDGAVYRLKNANGVNGLKYVNYIDLINGKPFRF